MTGNRGTDRGDELIKTTITLPVELLTELDVIVTYRKQTDRSFNRSALMHEALTAYVRTLHER